LLWAFPIASTPQPAIEKPNKGDAFDLDYDKEGSLIKRRRVSCAAITSRQPNFDEDPPISNPQIQTLDLNCGINPQLPLPPKMCSNPLVPLKLN